MRTICTPMRNVEAAVAVSVPPADTRALARVLTSLLTVVPVLDASPSVGCVSRTSIAAAMLTIRSPALAVWLVVIVVFDPVVLV